MSFASRQTPSTWIYVGMAKGREGGNVPVQVAITLPGEVELDSHIRLGLVIPQRAGTIQDVILSVDQMLTDTARLARGERIR